MAEVIEAPADDIIWFRCIGCGMPACRFTRARGSMPAGAVGHSKPVALLGQMDTVPCALYRGTKAQRYWQLHENAERIEAPISMSEQPSD